MPSAMSVATLFDGSVASLEDVVCRQGRGGPGAEEIPASSGIGFPSHGLFRWHDARGETLLDAHRAVLFNAGEPYRVEHPIEGGDATTTLAFPPCVVAEAVARRSRPLRRGESPFAVGSLAASTRSYALVQRLRKIASAPEGRDLEIEESALALLDGAVAATREPARGGPPPLRPAGARERRRRADAVRETLHARLGERVTLHSLSREIGVSPFHLARGFREEVGLPIHRYLNRLRLREALARRIAGAASLLGVALDAGFSSHAHFTDAFRKEFGVPPSRFARPASPAELREMRKNLEA